MGTAALVEEEVQAAGDQSGLERVQSRIETMQEAVAAEAARRVAAMHGKEEMWALEAALTAARNGNTDEVVEILEARQAKVKRYRRNVIMALSNDEDWDSDEECAPQAGGGDDNELEGAGTEFWEGAVGGALGISGSVEA